MAIINERHIDTDRAGDTQGGGNYDSLMDFMNQKQAVVVPFNETDITVNNAQYVLIDNTLVSGNIALDDSSNQTDGGVIAAPLSGNVGTADISTVLDSFNNITNLVEIRDSISHDPILDASSGRKIYGLFQVSSTVTDGMAITATGSEIAQLSFVIIESSGVLTLVNVDATIEIAISKLYAQRHLPTYRKVGKAINEEIIAPQPATASASIFVTDVTNDGTGIVGNKLYAPNTVPTNKIVTEATTDDDTVEIHFMVEGGVTYSPTVTVDGITCTNLQQYPNDQRLFFGSVSVNCNTTRSVPLVSDTGSTTSVLINRAAAGPEITNVKFVNGYPGTQTEVKNNDTFDIEIDFNPSGTEPVNAHIQDYGACKAQTISLAGSGLNWGTVHTATITVTIDYTGTTVQALPCRLNAENSLGTIGNTANTNDGGGTIDGTDLVNCNDVVPTFTDNGTSYPASQAAFKGTESGSQSTTVNDYSSVIYSSPNGDFTIANTTTYALDKTITCTNPGNYNDSTINFRIVASRAANDTQATFNKVIEVADIAPIVTVTQPQTRLRTSATGEDYTITASSNQNLANAPDINIPVSGIWQGSGFVGGAKIWTRTIRITDGDATGSAAWGWTTTAPVNNAGLSATITGNEVVGGFVSRDLILDPFATKTDLDTRVVDTSKLVMTWSFKPNMIFQAIGTSPPVVNGWTIDALNIDPTEVEILDTSAANASSQASTITIEETV